MNKSKKLNPNQGLVPKMIHPPFSLQSFMRKLKTKQALLQYRQDVMSATNRQNYINEYDRIAGLLSHSVTHRDIDHNRLKNRQAELKHLHEQSFNPTGHDISRK